jgi:hypothetical protein
MRATEILNENTDFLTVPEGVWKQVKPENRHDRPEYHGSPYVQTVYDRPTTKAWELHTSHGMISVLSQNIHDVRHIQGYKQFSPDWLKQNLQPLIQKANLQLPPSSDLKMVDQELVYVSKEYPLTPVVKVSTDLTWYTVSVPVFNTYYAKPWDSAKLPSDAQGDLYILKSISNTLGIVLVHDNKIISLSGYVQKEILNELMHAIHVQDSELSVHVDGGKTYVKHGQILRTDQLLMTNLVGKLSDNSLVYQVAPEYRWLVQVWFKKSYAPADQVYVVENPSQGGRAVFAIKNQKIVGNTTLSASMTTMRRWMLLLGQDLNLGVAPAMKIKPNSLLHKMLRYIKDHPGGNRTDVFVRGLGRKSTLGLGSINDLSTTDGLAWAGKLITPYAPGTAKYDYQITPKGIMMLAMLDAGKSVDRNSLVDFSKTGKNNP